MKAVKRPTTTSAAVAITTGLEVLFEDRFDAKAIKLSVAEISFLVKSIPFGQKSHPRDM